MYNMDSAIMLKEFKDETVNLLFEKKYLKEGFLNDLKRSKCHYLESDDLSKDGFVYCEYHGSLDGSIPEKEGGNPNDNYDPNREIYKQIILIAIIFFLPGILFFLINI